MSPIMPASAADTWYRRYTPKVWNTYVMGTRGWLEQDVASARDYESWGAKALFWLDLCFL